MHLLTLVVTLAIAFLMAGGALSLSLRRVPQGRSKLRRYLPALLAWVPLGVFAFWHPAGLTLSFLVFQVLCVVTVVGCVVYLLHRRFPMLRMARYTGVALVALALLALSIAWYWSLLLVLGLGIYAVKCFRRLSRMAANPATSVVEAASTRQRPERRTYPLVIAALIAAVLGLGALLFANLGSSTGNDSASAAQPSASPSAPPYHQRTAGQCVGEDGKIGGKTGFNVVFNSNQKNDDITGGIDTVNTEKGMNKVLDVAHHDPRYLFKLVEASPLGKERFPELKKYQQLMGTGKDDGCYSVLGRNAYNTLQGLLYSPKTKVVSTTASSGINSGTLHNGSPFLEPASVLTGDKRAMQITFANGQVMDILHRCGNVFVPGNVPPPNIPFKPPPPGHTPPPVCVTPPPPGSTGYVFNNQKCAWEKPAQSWNCQQNGGPNCPPNPAHQPVQSNDPSLTKQPSTVPTKAPPKQSPEPVDTQHPSPPNSGGHDGGSGPNPIVTGSPTPVDTASHAAPIPTPTGGPFG